MKDLTPPPPAAGITPPGAHRPDPTTPVPPRVVVGETSMVSLQTMGDTVVGVDVSIGDRNYSVTMEGAQAVVKDSAGNRVTDRAVLDQVRGLVEGFQDDLIDNMTVDPATGASNAAEVNAVQVLDAMGDSLTVD